MINLRAQAELDLAETLEAEYALPVVLIAPDGISQSVTGQVLYDTIEENPETGVPIVVNNPLVTIRRSSLARIPISDEKWVVKIPTSPSLLASLEEFIIDATKPPIGGRTLGFIRLSLKKVAQLS